MKKILIAVVLVLAMALSLTLAACASPVSKIEVKEGTINSTYNVGDTIDYKKGVLVVTYEDGTTKEVKFTDSGVKYNTISTATAGEYTLTVTYKGKTTTFDITIEGGSSASVTVETFKAPASYSNYEERSTDNSSENSFTRRDEVYKVGSINKFEFAPVAEYFNDNDRLQIIANVETTMKLYCKETASAAYGEVLADDEAATYVTKTGNMYQFATVANDKFFKMEISLDETAYEFSDSLEESTLTIEFQVVDAYNVYDMFGLSVYDNLNVKHWAEIKNRTLKWDDKKLSEYTDVKEIVLHADIDINPDNLPATYFWTTSTKILVGDDSTATKGYTEAQAYVNTCPTFANADVSIVGTLIDGVGDGSTFRMCKVNENLIENYYVNTVQKALYLTNQCDISGNYMAVKTVEAATSGRKLVSYVTNEKNAKDNPKSHWAILGAMKTSQGDNLSLSVENLQITGNMSPNADTNGEPAGLMGMIGGLEDMRLTNVNMYTCFTHFTTVSNGGLINEDAQTTVSLIDCKFEQAYSNMVYGYRTAMNIENCRMTDAGGPLFILVDGDDRKASNYDEGRKCSLTVDENSVLEAYAAGTESWYQAYGASSLINYIKTWDVNLLQKYAKVTIQHEKSGAGQSVNVINFIAAILPEPANLTKSPSNADDRVWIKGDCKLLRAGGANELYSMEDAVFNQVKSTNTVMFKCGNNYGIIGNTQQTLLVNPITQQASTAWTNHSDMMCIYMNTTSLTGANAPYFGVIVGGVETVSA